MKPINELVSFRVEGMHYIMCNTDFTVIPIHNNPFMIEDTEAIDNNDIIDVIKRFGICGEPIIEYKSLNMTDMGNPDVKTVIINISYNFSGIEHLWKGSDAITINEYQTLTPGQIISTYISITNHSIKQFFDWDSCYIEVYDYHTTELEKYLSYKQIDYDATVILNYEHYRKMYDSYFSSIERSLENTIAFINFSKRFNEAYKDVAKNKVAALLDKVGITKYNMYYKTRITHPIDLYNGFLANMMLTFFDPKNATKILFNRYFRQHEYPYSLGSSPTLLPLVGCDFSPLSLSIFRSVINKTNYYENEQESTIE